MTEQEARQEMEAIAQRLLNMGMKPTKLGEHILMIRRVAQGDVAKSLEGFRALERKVNELLQQEA